jgi:hypothetical protein
MLFESLNTVPLLKQPICCEFQPHTIRFLSVWTTGQYYLNSSTKNEKLEAFEICSETKQNKLKLTYKYEA